jgi:membrane-associated protease RseP (regulator of RpoE activity)
VEPYPHLPPAPPTGRVHAEGSILTEYDAPPRRQRYGLHLLLFLLTLASTVYTGGSLVGRFGLYFEPGGWAAYVLDGLRFAVPFLLFLTAHEFGHFFAARRHGVDVSLPYYIPLGPLGFGTLGAVIRIREPIRRTRQLFDIGAAGPLAGAVVAFVLLAAALAALPPPTYLLDVPGHERTVAFVLDRGAWPPVEPPGAGGMVLLFGDTPLFGLVRQVAPGLPSPSELMHYPVLLAAWLALFFTALNLLPVGQLDGGHVVYALFGPRVHAFVARAVTLALFVSGAVGFVRDVPAMAGRWAWAVLPVLGLVLLALFSRFFREDWRLVLAATGAVLALAYGVNAFAPGLAAAVGYWGWLIWVGLIVFLIRVDHPPVLVHEPLSPGRRALGYLCLVLFVLSFSIQPITTW